MLLRPLSRHLAAWPASPHPSPPSACDASKAGWRAGGQPAAAAEARQPSACTGPPPQHLPLAPPLHQSPLAPNCPPHGSLHVMHSTVHLGQTSETGTISRPARHLAPTAPLNVLPTSLRPPLPQATPCPRSTARSTTACLRPSTPRSCACAPSRTAATASPRSGEAGWCCPLSRRPPQPGWKLSLSLAGWQLAPCLAQQCVSICNACNSPSLCWVFGIRLNRLVLRPPASHRAAALASATVATGEHGHRVALHRALRRGMLGSLWFSSGMNQWRSRRSTLVLAVDTARYIAAC